jgi:multiple sugar transport system substrate-binding protein
MAVRRWAVLRILVLSLAMMPAAWLPAFAVTEITLARFFGACDETVTRIADARGEACIVQAIIDGFNAANPEIRVRTMPTGWRDYYQQIRAAYESGTPPDVHVLHRHRLAEFAGLDVLAPLSADLAKAGIDFSDWDSAALEAVMFDDQILGMPFDFHANLWHLNMEILAAAGLVDGAGRPILPASPGELLEHARLVEEATGKAYLTADFSQFPIGVRAILSLLWQQGRNVFEEGRATVDTPEFRAAITTMTELFEAGYANPTLDYSDSQQGFLQGEAAVLINGTWVVDFYTAEAALTEVPLTDYYVASFPTLFSEPATWADSHMWVVPATLQAAEPEKYAAVLELLAWINDHNQDWARTGHVAIRTSVLESEAYAALPHRSEYLETASMARDLPASPDYGPVQRVLNDALQSIWLAGRPLDEALAEAQTEVQEVLDRAVQNAARNVPGG